MKLSQPNSVREYKFDISSQESFISYYQQIKNVLQFKPHSCLVIGQGDNIIPYILMSQGIEVDTFDIVEDMKPTYLGDVSQISNIVDKKYDVILCCEVLEHLPFDQFERSLGEIKKLCNRGGAVVLSLPVFGLAGYVKIWAPKYINLSWIISVRYYKPGLKVMCPTQHYWEINSKGTRLKKVKQSILKYYKIMDNYRVKETPYHMFFVLKPIPVIEQ